ncbi:MAG: serine/threonine-protein kinase [Rubripirellula sp.]
MSVDQNGNRPNGPLATRESDSDAFQDLLVECLDAIQEGHAIDLEELRRQHPDHADSISEFLENHKLFQQAIGEIRPSMTQVAISPDARTRVRRGASGSTFWSLAGLKDREFPIPFGEYSLLREIDRGGMGIVFKALHINLNRVVALKIMRSGEMASEEELRRFRAEAEASAAVKHPNIIPIFEVGESHGLVYFTMGYVDGRDLATRLKERKFSPREAVRIVARIADAVAAAHRDGVIHRDLKPSNILIDDQGDPFLIDFGLAKVQASSEALTTTGQILGTPAYMSPEQASGKLPHDATTCDVYSLGAVLYEMLTGQPPFSGPSPFDILLQVLNREPPQPRKLNRDVPRDLEKIVNRAMEKSINDRYQTADDLQADLQRFLLDEPIHHPKPGIHERLNNWWRREPILVSHLAAIASVMLVMIVVRAVKADSYENESLKFGLLFGWIVGSTAFQRLSVVERFTQAAHWGWAAFDVMIYTVLLYHADPPRGLLLIGYPMMITASGLFYRARFVVFVTGLCLAGFVFLWRMVLDPSTIRADFCVIYMMGLVVLGLCLVAMIRRIRGLSEYFDDGK